MPAPVNGSSPPAGPLGADEEEPPTSAVVLVVSWLLELAPEVVVAPEVLVAPEVVVPPLVWSWCRPWWWWWWWSSGWGRSR